MVMMVTRLSSAWSLALGLMMFGVVTGAPSMAWAQPLADPAFLEPATAIDQDDEIVLIIDGEPDLSGAYVVKSNGTIDIPYVSKAVLVKGILDSDVKCLVVTELKRGVLIHPVVQVSIRRFVS